MQPIKLKKEMIVDLSLFRKGSKPFGKIIDVCPHCGKKGEIHKYKNGSMLVEHSKRYDVWCWTVKESCYIKKS